MPGKKYTRRDRKQSTRSTTRKYKAKGGLFGLFSKPVMPDIEMGNEKRIRALVNAGAQVKFVVCNHPSVTRRTPSVATTPRKSKKKTV